MTIVLCLRSILVATLAAGVATGAEASHLVVDLVVEGAKPVRATTDAMPPAHGSKARPVARLKAHDSVKLRWSVKNPDRARKQEKLLVHVFIVRAAKAGQKEVPDPRQGSLWESAHATALEAGAQTSGQFQVPIDEPGTYLARVETQFTDEDHEHFAAIDLQVE